MVNVLDKIIEDKKESLKVIKKTNSLDSLENTIKSLNNFLNFKDAISNNKGVSLITEIKKASPSAGELVKDFNHLNIAKMYVDNGATCLSVLTEEKHFLGKLDYIRDIKKKFKIPVLAKDFFIDPYQIALSKSYGSDCILIIVAALDTKLADEIYAEAIRHKLSVIVEVHDNKEAENALKYDNALIGVNNRNLKTFEVNIENSIELRKEFQENNIFVSESGIKTQKDIDKLKEHNINVFLIGESLMKGDFF